MIETASISVIDPCLLLLRSLHLEVLYEGCELIKLLMSYGNVRDDLMAGLVALLKPSKIDMQNVPDKGVQFFFKLHITLPSQFAYYITFSISFLEITSQQLDNIVFFLKLPV